jgi:hypothetical protein
MNCASVSRKRSAQSWTARPPVRLRPGRGAYCYGLPEERAKRKAGVSIPAGARPDPPPAYKTGAPPRRGPLSRT